MSRPIEDEIAHLGPWHHDVEVAPGVWTGAHRPEGSDGTAPSLIRPAEILAELLHGIFPGGLEGRSVLDCACNAGGYLFAATEAGAGAGFGFDAREHWIRQARFIAQHVPSSNLEFSVLALEDLPGLGLDPFDVTLFNGIFYHLPDPVHGLRTAADHTRELLIVNTAFKPAREQGLVLSIESDVEVTSGVDRLAWLPTGVPVLNQILEWCGFAHTRVWFVAERAPHSPPDWGRMGVLAARDPGTFASFDRVAGDPSLRRHERRRSRWWRARRARH